MSKIPRKRGGTEPHRPQEASAERAAEMSADSLPAPPRPRRWLIVLASVLLAAWMVALAVLAFAALDGRG